MLIFSHSAFCGALNFRGGERIEATIIEPIFNERVFIGFSFECDSVCINDEELPIYHAIDAEFSSSCVNDTITLLSFYTNDDIVETRIIHDGPRWSFDKKGGVYYFDYLPKPDYEKGKFYHVLMHGRSAENLEKTIKSWQLDNIADMVLYSGAYPNSPLGCVYCDRIITTAGKIINWERIIIGNVFFWLSPSLIEQMPIEYDEDKSVIFTYNHYLDHQIKMLQKENAPIDEIKSRKFWRYNE